jgi:broad specificity phosphatase PhoE
VQQLAPRLEQTTGGTDVALLGLLALFGLLAALLLGASAATTRAPAAAAVPRPALRADERLLLWDTSGPGHAIVTVGNLAQARDVAIVVPGVGTSLSTFEHGLGGVARRAPLEMARHLREAMRLAAPGTATAAVAWLDYDPPAEPDLQAAGEADAADGARRLAAFVTALRATHPAVHVTIVGHSYGAVVAGLAARAVSPSGGLDLVLLAAPGAGADTARELGGARVFTALAADDWVRDLPELRLPGLALGLGRRPASAGFGGIPLPARTVHGHDHYLDPGTDTLIAVAGVCTWRQRLPRQQEPQVGRG